MSESHFLPTKIFSQQYSGNTTINLNLIGLQDVIDVAKNDIGLNWFTYAFSQNSIGIQKLNEFKFAGKSIESKLRILKKETNGKNCNIMNLVTAIEKAYQIIKETDDTDVDYDDGTVSEKMSSENDIVSSDDQEQPKTKDNTLTNNIRKKRQQPLEPFSINDFIKELKVPAAEYKDRTLKNKFRIMTLGNRLLNQANDRGKKKIFKKMGWDIAEGQEDLDRKLKNKLATFLKLEHNVYPDNSVDMHSDFTDSVAGALDTANSLINNLVRKRPIPEESAQEPDVEDGKRLRESEELSSRVSPNNLEELDEGEKDSEMQAADQIPDKDNPSEVVGVGQTFAEKDISDNMVSFHNPLPDESGVESENNDMESDESVYGSVEGGSVMDQNESESPVFDQTDPVDADSNLQESMDTYDNPSDFA